MDDQKIREIFEAFHDKYKKTEGDESAWSAFWRETMPSGADVEVNLTKCPRGNVFKLFKDGRKQGEIVGWDEFRQGVGDVLGDDWDAEAFFSSMKDMT